MPVIEVTGGRLQAQAMAYGRSIDMPVTCRCEAFRRVISLIDQMLSEVGDFGKAHLEVAVQNALCGESREPRRAQAGETELASSG